MWLCVYYKATHLYQSVLKKTQSIPQTDLSMSANIVGSLRVVGTLGEPAADGGAVRGRVVRRAAGEAREVLAARAVHAPRALARARAEYPLWM